MISLAVPAEDVAFESVLDDIPNKPAVFALWPREGAPYLARTNVLRRRFLRLLGPRKQPSRMLNLRGTVERIEYQLTGSTLESQFVLLDWAKRCLGADYRDAVRLRMPPYVKLIRSNEFPRTQVTTHIGRARAVYFGPFRNRSTAARFESEFLDLFQLRRCQEDLHPFPQHPGCIYGEMNRCLRPCQQAVGREEYRQEAERVAEFLATSGRSLLQSTSAARERLSAEMDFEGAAAMHSRYGRIEEVLGLADEMVREVDSLHAVAIAPSPSEQAVELGWIRNGYWQGFRQLSLPAVDGTAVSLDTRLRELAASISDGICSSPERMEQLAIVSRWFYSSWCEGEMLLVDDWNKIPIRKLVNAVSRVAQSKPRRSTRS